MEDEEYLREKARLLLQRERELFDLRVKHERLALWLRLGHTFPTLFVDRSESPARIWDSLRKMLISQLRLQRVHIHEVHPGELVPLAGRGSTVALPKEAAAMLAQQASGYCNDPELEDVDPAVRVLADALGLHRFMWSSFLEDRGAPVLIAAGFDKTKAVFQTEFDDEHVAHFRNATKHLESMLSNFLLVSELEGETKKLQQANETLEQRDHALRALTEQLQAANESLEERVAHRTRELAGKNQELRLVLDNVDQALLTIDLDGYLAPERSRMVECWFGPLRGRSKFVDYAKPDSGFVDLLEMGLLALKDDFLPRGFNLGQFPQRFTSGPRTYACRFLPIDEGGVLVGLLLVIDDVTDQLARAREEAEQREMLAAFRALMKDRSGLLTFVEESERMLQELNEAGADSALQKRLLHTLKGNASTFDLLTLADVCHEAESELDNENAVRSQTMQRIVAQWRVVTSRLSEVMPTDSRGLVQVTEKELDSLAETARQGATAEQIVQRIARLRWEPLTGPLGRLARHAETLAERLGKGPLEVEVETTEIRVAPERWAPLWSALVHVVRNAVDHGIEPSGERIAAGKSPQGSLRLSAHRKRQGYLIKIADDGRGIDWSAIRALCVSRGWPAESQEDLLRALLSEGFTTCDTVTVTSGRGVGLAALQSVVMDLGGEISVESEPGLGTCWTLLFPDAVVDGGD